MKHLTLTDDQFETLIRVVNKNNDWNVDLSYMFYSIEQGRDYHGDYVGSHPTFEVKKGIVQPIGNSLVKVQMDYGPLWMTHSWITFLAKDWEPCDAD